MNSFVPEGPVIRRVTGPIPGSAASSNLRNGQHSRSATINSAASVKPRKCPGFTATMRFLAFERAVAQEITGRSQPCSAR